MSEVIGSTMARRTIGRGIKTLRERAGMLATTAARAIEMSPQTFWRMEGGHPVRLKQVYIRVLCEMFEAPEEATAALTALVLETKNPVWWRNVENVVPADLELLLALEDNVQHMTTVHPSLVPPVLQTPEYRRVLAHTETADRPPWKTERWLKFLDQRYQRLLMNTSRITAILCQAVLDDPDGPNEVLANQIEHLITIGERPEVSIRIIPGRVGVHVGLITGAFDLLEFPEHPVSLLSEPPVVHLPGYTSAVYVDHGAAIVEYRAAIEAMRQVALDEDASRQLLQDISRTHYRSSGTGAAGLVRRR